MYQREIRDVRENPIENGIPRAGTWTRAFDHVDLLDVRHPFSIPLPKWMKDYRIKEWQSFIVQDERFYLNAVLINVKYCRVAQVFLYNIETKEQLRFRKIIPLGAWKFPRELYNSSITSESYGFYFRIHNWLDADTVKVDLDIEPSRNRPSFTAHLEFDLNRTAVTPMAVDLPFAERRNLYSFNAFAPVRGDMVFGGQHISFDPAKTSGFFMDSKGFFPYRMRYTKCSGAGFDAEGRRLGFNIAENQAKEAHKNNQNALWINGELTALPSVRITMPMGGKSDWVIQDLEGMVDLLFTPSENYHGAKNFIVARAEYITALGYYNGMLLNSRGENIPVRNVWGVGEKLYLRM